MPADLVVSDADRELVVALLTEQVGAGRLALGQFDSRAAAAYAAQTHDDLDVLTRDLPTVLEAQPDDSRDAWRAWGLTGAICLVIWIATSVAAGGPTYFWPAWVIGPWGAMLLVRHFTGRPDSCS